MITITFLDENGEIGNLKSCSFKVLPSLLFKIYYNDFFVISFIDNILIPG